MSIVGPFRSATSVSAYIAACHSGSVASFFERVVMKVAASRSVTSTRPPGSGIGSSNSRRQPRRDFISYEFQFGVLSALAGDRRQSYARIPQRSSATPSRVIDRSRSKFAGGNRLPVALVT
jgi:hypothetical protein